MDSKTVTALFLILGFGFLAYYLPNNALEMTCIQNPPGGGQYCLLTLAHYDVFMTGLLYLAAGVGIGLLISNIKINTKKQSK